MKKTLCVVLGLCLLCTLAAGCSETAKGDFVDLTAMSEMLRIAELTNITSSPTAYEGKTIRLGGLYQANYYEPTKQYYHCVIIADAAACCQQGLEFEWSGKHKCPEDYPQDGTPIELTGVLESYEEFGNTYYRLAVEEIVCLDKL